LLSESWW